MYSKELEEKLKELNIEDFIWVIYIGIIILSWYSNSLERKYFIYKDQISKEKYRKIIILIFTVLLLVYVYFFKSSYKDLKNINECTSNKKRKLVELSFIASFLILVSGVIFLYIAFEDEELSVELAFN